MICYSVLCVVLTSIWFQVKVCVMKVQVSSVNPKEGLKPWVPNRFSVFLLPCLCRRLHSLIITRSRQEFDYYSYEKFPGFPNLLFVTKLSRIKEKNSFSMKKERKQSKKERKLNSSYFDGSLESFEYTNFKSLEKFYKSFSKWKSIC